MPMDSISMCSTTLYMYNIVYLMDVGCRRFYSLNNGIVG
jgi:hypothetical protein